MAKSKASRSRRSGAGSRQQRGSQRSTGQKAAAPSRAWGLDPSWFAFRARDPRGLVVQLLSLAGLAAGLGIATTAYGSSTVGNDQVTQLAWLASILGFLVVPIAAAAIADGLVATLGRRGSLGKDAGAKLGLVLPVVAAFLVGLAVAPLLFALGGQWLYLGVAFVCLVAVVALSAIQFLRGGSAPEGGRAG